MGYTKPIKDNVSPQSPKTKDTGDWGEQIAMQHLVSLGCAIRETQWRGNGFEIDLIAQKGDRIIFVEVKTRKNAEYDPAEAVDNKKRQRMIRAADIYLKELKLPFGYQFDIISVTGTKDDYKVEHIPDAFFPIPRTRH